MKRSAIISTNQQHRYVLIRNWTPTAQTPKTMIIVGLNPSTADAKEDDPTIRRCVGFAQAYGCTQLVMLNLFALRSTDPDALETAVNRVGPRNDTFLSNYAAWPDTIVVVAWGAHPMARHRAQPVLQILRAAGAKPMCFGRTKDGAPRHPLYLSADTKLEPYE